MREITTIAEWDALKLLPDPVVFLKHSGTCDRSQYAFERLLQGERAGPVPGSLCGLPAGAGTLGTLETRASYGCSACISPSTHFG